MIPLERRRSVRSMMMGFVTLTAEVGPLKGSTYSAMLRDVSGDRGVCILLDGECGLTRGSKVVIGFADAPPQAAWVCHNTRDGETFRIGVCFDPLETPQIGSADVSLSAEDDTALRRTKLAD